MTFPARRRFWTRPRLLAVGLVAAILAIFIAANTHLIYVAFASQSDCVLSSSVEGAATYRAAKPSC